MITVQHKLLVIDCFYHIFGVMSFVTCWLSTIVNANNLSQQSSALIVRRFSMTVIIIYCLIYWFQISGFSFLLSPWLRCSRGR